MPGRDGAFKIKAAGNYKMRVLATQLQDSGEENRPTIVMTLETVDAPHDWIEDFIYTKGNAIGVAVDKMKAYGYDLNARPISALAGGGIASDLLGAELDPVIIVEETYEKSNGTTGTSFKVKQVGEYVLKGLIDNAKAKTLDDAFLKAVTAPASKKTKAAAKPATPRLATTPVESNTPVDVGV